MNWSDIDIEDLEPHQITDCKMMDDHIILIMNRIKTSTIRRKKYDYKLAQVLRMDFEKKDAVCYAVVTGINEVTVPHDLNADLLQREGDYDSVDEFYNTLENLGFDTDSFPRDFNQYDIEFVTVNKKEEDPWEGEEYGEQLVEN